MEQQISNNSCYMQIDSSSSNEESRNWPNMLARMYTRWNDANHHITEIMNCHYDDEEITSYTIKIIGNNPYETLKNETGIHRLVRSSPYDKKNRRHTSFASVLVYPVIDSSDKQIDEKDIEFSYVYSRYIRQQPYITITHKPTGIVITCDVHTGRHKNREAAMNILHSRLYDYEMRLINNDHRGKQIRSYVFDPYKLVKDYITGKETDNIEDVLDGNINMFLEVN